MKQVLGVLSRSNDPVGVELKLTPIRIDQLTERILVAGAGTREDLLGHARILAPTRSVTRITSNDVSRCRNSPVRVDDADFRPE